MSTVDYSYYDEREIRSKAQRAEYIAYALPMLISHAQKNCENYQETLGAINPRDITDIAALAKLPVIRKSELVASDGTAPFRRYIGRPFREIQQIFQSPGPIYEPGMLKADWWRMARFLYALGIRDDDIVQNCFSYHFTPAGMMFESASRKIGAKVVPAGTGQSEMQAMAMANIGVTAYAGTPDYLKTILEKAEALGLDISRVKRAAVSGGPLLPDLRAEYDRRGIFCRQCYGTAELGLIAYESKAREGLIIDEGVVVEIVTPGTGIPVMEGEVGEVVVTSFNHDFPMIRLATGDLSAILPGESPCGRTNMRIVGWRGRADQATKVRGMFVRPEQIALLVARFEPILKARIIVTHDGSKDQMHVKLETNSGAIAGIHEAISDILKLQAKVEWVAPGSLPKDGMVIEDQRIIH